MTDTTDRFKIGKIDIKKKQKLIELILNHLADLKKTIQIYQPLETGTVLDDVFGRYVVISDPIYAAQLLNYILFHIQRLVDKARQYGLLNDDHEIVYYQVRGAIEEMIQRMNFIDKMILTGEFGEIEIIKLLGYIETFVVSLTGLQDLIEEYEEKQKIPDLEKRFNQLLDVEKKEFLSRIIDPKLVRALPMDKLKEIRDVAIQVVGLDADAIFEAIQKLSPSDRINLIIRTINILTPIEARDILEAIDQLTRADISDVLRRAVGRGRGRRRREQEGEEEEEE